MKKDIRLFLEEAHRLHFYDLLGGLADNLLTLGKFAGTFTSCDACGNTITLKERSWSCESCGEEFNLHFSTLKEVKGTKEAQVKVRGIRKSKLQPHWYFADENWSAGEFINLIMRFPAEFFLSGWLKHLGIKIDENNEICNLLCWARIKFGSKTIQPDLIIEFEKDLVIFEFKRPEGGLVPPKEIIGQIIFINNASKILNKSWHLVIVPGPNFIVRESNEYVEEAMNAIDEAKNNWSLPNSIIEETKNLNFGEIDKSLSAFGWENLIDNTIDFIIQTENSWTSKQVIEKLQYFKSSRIKLGLFPNNW